MIEWIPGGTPGGGIDAKIAYDKHLLYAGVYKKETA
jgi:hypothetical protein